MKIALPNCHSLTIILLLGTAISASAQVRFAVTSYTDRGGGSSSGGTFTVLGTEGQSDAGISTGGGGRFGVAGGFWSTVEEALPRLAIRRQGNQVILSWPNPSTGFQLEQTSVLGPSGWANVGAVPSVVGSNKEVSLTIGPSSRGFRLRRP